MILDGLINRILFRIRFMGIIGSAIVLVDIKNIALQMR